MMSKDNEYCFLIWRDTSGRGEKGMLRFDSAEAREKHVRECLADFAEAIADEESGETAENSLNDLIARLDRGETVHEEDDRTEWEYM